MANKTKDNNESIEIRGIKVTHPNKILYPKSKITKLDIINYYLKVEKKFLEVLDDRILSLVRAPEGIDKQKFFQKHPAENFPDYIDKIKIKEKEGVGYYITIDQIEDIIYLVNLGVLEFHVGNSTAADFEHPTRIIFDLDPGEGSKYEYIVEGSYELKDILDDMGLKNSVKTSGGKGFHIIAELDKKTTWKESKDLSFEIAKELAGNSPIKFTTSLPKEDRVGRVFIDYLRNERGATAIAAYSTRAREGASISMPISWKDVEKVKPNEFTIKDF